MILKYLNKTGNVEIDYMEFGAKLVGKRFIEISISPEEIIGYNSEVDSERVTMDYIRKLTRHYKKND